MWFAFSRGGGDSRQYIPLSETVPENIAAKIQQYNAWGEPLDVRLNDHCHRFAPSSERRPGSANATTQHMDGLLGTPLRPCIGL